MGIVVTVSGAVGGIGTSTFAYALALHSPSSAVLIDVQPDGVPLDVLIGSEDVPGTRWSQVRVQSDAIAADAILTALPEFHGVRILSADADATADPRAVGILVEVLRGHVDLVVLDIPSRHPLIDALNADTEVLLAPPTLLGVCAVLASRSAAQLVVTDTGHAGFRPARMHEYLDSDIAGVVRWERAVHAAAAACTTPPTSTDVMRVAQSVWQGLADA